MPEAYPLFPSRAQLRSYLGAYARHFGVLDRIRFGRRVERVCQQPQQQPHRWRVQWSIDAAVAAAAEDTRVASERDHAALDTAQWEAPDAGQHEALGGEEGAAGHADVDAVAVCNGHHRKPIWPDPADFPGCDTFAGTSIHSMK